MELIKPETYYILFAFYRVSVENQRKVREHEKYIQYSLNNKRAIEDLTDAIYNPASSGTQLEFNDILLKAGVQVEWQEAKNKFAKQKEEEENVGG